MQATRWEILQRLKEQGEATVDELARMLDLAPITVRHHLAILEKDGLITNRRERGSIGRPYHVYSLTPAAEELFPKKYHLLADRLLAELKSIADEQQITAMFDRIAQGITAEYDFDGKSRGLEDRLAVLIEVLGEEGFLAEWTRVGDEYELKEYSCPYYYVGQHHPEVCKLDLQVITNLLAAKVERHSCVIDGDEFCVYRIKPVVSITDLMGDSPAKTSDVDEV
jgi:DeoR family suf operon transcriptional repressor